VVYVHICDTFDNSNDHAACTSRRFTTTTSTAGRADVPPSSHLDLSSRHRSCAYRVQRRRCWLHVINFVTLEMVLWECRGFSKRTGFQQLLLFLSREVSK
jgi:hypothetical protein